jgi:hypothetical protein
VTVGDSLLIKIYFKMEKKSGQIMVISYVEVVLWKWYWILIKVQIFLFPCQRMTRLFIIFLDLLYAFSDDFFRTSLCVLCTQKESSNPHVVILLK